MESDPYAPPRKIEGDPLMPEDEMDALRPTWKVRAAWMSLFATGLMLISSAGQLVVSVEFLDPVLAAIPYAMLVLGAITFPCAIKLKRMLGWAAVAGVVLAGLITVSMLAWTAFAGSRGLVSLLHTLVPVVSGAATVFCIMILGACRRAGEARAKLAESGIDARF
jgi:hypothetical protein